MVVLALRYTFTESTPGYDALLRPIMSHLGALLTDGDLVRTPLGGSGAA